MSLDQKQNTEALQERFPDVYRKFFAENDLVVSFGYHFAFLTGMLDWLVGGPVINQKLPFRAYVGLQRNNKGNSVKLGRCLTYYHEQQAFGETDLSTFLWDAVIAYVQQYRERLLGNAFKGGCTLNFLFERPENLGFDNGSSVGIVVAFQLYAGVLQPEQVAEMAQLSGLEIQNKETPVSLLFNDVRRHALKLTALFTGGFTSGSAGFTAFVDSAHPTVHFVEERGGSVSKPYNGLAIIDLEGQIDKLDHLHLWGFRLHELTNISGTFPLDAVSIHFSQGHEGYPSRARHVKEVVLPDFDQLRNFTKDIFKPVRTTDEHAPVFLKHLDLDGDYLHNYGQGRVYPRLFFLRCLVELYQQRLSTAAANRVLESLNVFMNPDAPFEEPYSSRVQLLIRKLFDTAHRVNTTIGLRVLSAWGKQDGNILVLSKLRSFREPLLKMITELQRDGWGGITTDFVSWQDGWGKDGIRVEQFISKGIYSKFVGRESYRLREWDGGGGEVERVTEDVEETKGEFDILLDKVDGKIYINGEECTSRELPTQKAAIEIVVYLLEHREETVPNKALPAQTYTSYRNEFQGKIVTPLNQLLKKRLGKDLGLKIHGKLMAFDVQFNPVDLKIGILEKVG